MKRKVKTIFCILVYIIFSLVVLIGCNYRQNDYNFEFPETGKDAFTYNLIDDEVCITGLTEFGRGLKEIKIPKEIDGVKVTRLMNVAEQPAYGYVSSFKTTCDKIVLSENIKHIDKYFFSQTEANVLLLNKELQKVPSRAFAWTGIKEVIIPDGISEIEEFAFGSSLSLERIIIPSSIKRISDSSFRHCTELEYLVFEEGIEEIGYAAFAGCEELRVLDFPDSLLYIDDWAFGADPCRGEVMKLESVHFGGNLKEIGDCAFAYNNKLNDITGLDKNKVIIGDDAFYRTRMF